MSVWPTINDIAKQVQAGTVTAEQYVAQSLDLIKKHEDFNAVIAVIDTRALERARALDVRVANGEQVGRLAGVPFIAKDNFLVFGADTTAASNILRGFTAPYQATVIERLEAAGAICVAKANMDAFGHGISTENSDFGVTLHPADRTRVPGGSSGGSAAAVMLDLAPFSIGTDTGGSTRQPASLVGCVGYKPTYGLMSRSGVVAMASSTDTVGTLARTVDEAALVVDVMAGQDPLDSTTIARDPAGYTTLDGDLAGKKIGVIAEWMTEGLDDYVRTAVTTAYESLRAAGAVVEEVHLPSLPLALAAYYIVIPAEISSNLSRYDGQRFGYSDQDVASLEASYTGSREHGFGKEAKRRIMIGTYVLSSGYYDAYYKKAQTVRTKLINEFNQALTDYDFLVGPVSPTPAFKIGDNATDPLKMYLADVMTVAPSLVGIPAISIPCRVNGGLPVGLQIMARQRADRDLLSIAQAMERAL